MEGNNINIDFEKYKYLYKTLYLIKTNLPSFEYLYIIMFFLKYIGIILFSTSLNKWNNDSKIQIKKDLSQDITSISSNNKIHSFFENFLINGYNLKILTKHYAQMCILGFCFLIVYILCFVFGIFYMKNKYYDNEYLPPIKKKIKNINKQSIKEKKFFKIISYIFFIIVFLHQYLIEYYIFGFLGYFLNLFGVFDTNLFKNDITEYTVYVNEHLKHTNFEPIIIIIINLITIIILLLFFIVFMMINSTKTLFIHNGIPLYGNEKILVIKMIFFNFNPLYGLINSFNHDIKIKVTIIFIIIFIILNLINILFSFYDFSFYPDKLNYFCLFIDFFILFANITEIILYFTNSQINSTTFLLFKLIIELINSIIFTVLFIYKKNYNSKKIFVNNLFDKDIKIANQSDIYYYIEMYLHYSHDKKNNYFKLFTIFQNHILSCDKKECPCNLLLSKCILLNANNIKKNKENDYQIENNKLLSDKNLTQKDTINILEVKNNLKNNIKDKRQSIDKSLSNFKPKTTEENKNKEEKSVLSSPSIHKLKSIENKPIPLNLKNKNLKENKELKKNEKNSKLKDEEFQMIGEQEIINRINFLYERKNYSLLENYIFIHLQYLIKIKQNYRLALYFVGKYSGCELKFSLLSRYFLYEIKKYICKNIVNLNNLKIIKDPYIIKYKEDNILMKNVKNYFIYYHMIKHLLRICCEKIIYFYKFRKDLHNPLLLQKYSKIKIFPIIKDSEEIITCIDKLKFIIEKIYKEEKHTIESVELTYLLTNFFKLIYGKIPEDITNYISPIIYFTEIEFKKLANEFHHFLMNNPLIISLNNKDSFDTKYFTNIFLNKLNYTYMDLKNKDFHEKLFPGEQDLCKEHSFILKQFLFFHKNAYTKENTFLKSKEGYLISINFTCKVFPNFKEDFSLIANIIFQDNLIENKKSYFKKKEDNKIINIYSFVLNHDFYIYSLTKNFYLEYYLNHNMFRELRINFCRFFCVDESKLIEQIDKEVKKLLKKHKNFNFNIPLREANKAYSIFQNIKIENTFKIRGGGLLEYYIYPGIFFYEKIDKKKLFQLIPEIINIIDEIGLDYDWYIKLNNYKERLLKNNNFQKINESEIYHDNYQNYNNDRFSTVFGQNNNYENNYNSDQFFEVIYSIKRLGSVSYYIVNLNEKMNKNLDQTQISKKYKTISKKQSFNLINKNILNRINSKKSIKISKTSSLHLKEDIINEEKQNNNLNTINTSNKNKNNEENKKDSKINNELNLNNNLKKVEKKSKLYKKDIVKNIKKRNNLNEEEDEDSLLISKNKFKEIISKNSKINRILIIILNILSLISIISVFIKMFFNANGFKDSNNILTASITLEMLKVDVYYEAIFSIMYCVYESDELIEKNKINSDANINLLNILDHLKVMQDQVKIILNNKFSIHIFKVIEESFIIHSLNSDWTILHRKADILNEMRRLSYILYNLTSTNETCNISLFYEYLEKGPEDFKFRDINSPNGIQQIFYYILSNIISNFQLSFEKLSNQCIITLKTMWNYYQLILFSILIFILIILILFIIIYIIKICFDYYYYKIVFLYFYDIKEEHLKFQNKIKYFHKTILDFNHDNINYFEYIRNNEKIIDYKKDINQKNLKYISKKSSLTNDIANKKKFKKRDTLANILSNKNQIFEQNNIKGNLLNDSMNGSSLQFLNNSNKKIFLNNNIEEENNNNNAYIAEKNDKELENDYEETSIDLLMKIANKIIPNSFKIYSFLILFGLLIYILLCILNIIEIYNQSKIWDFSINLLMNILERMPRLLGLVLYPCINVISNNINNITNINNHLSKYLDYFEANSLYYSEDILNKYFNNNYFGQILKDNLRINYNLDNYLTSNTIFTNTRKWESLLNLEGYFCIYGAMGKIELFNPFISFYDYIKFVDNNAINCFKENTGINEYGVKNEINYIIQEITNKYIDFITYSNSNMTLQQARTNFFNSKEIKRIFIDFQNSFLLYFNTIINTIGMDFKELKITIGSSQNLYSYFLFLINYVILFFIILTISKGEKYKRLFIYISEIPKNFVN